MGKEDLERAAHLIRTASIDGRASVGQQHLAAFIASCLEYSEKANIKEVLFREDIGAICSLLKIAQAGDLLRSLVVDHNPSLLSWSDQ